MGQIVGDSIGYSTWGKFRCAWCLQSNYDYTGSAFWITYNSGLKASATGSGLIRYVSWYYGDPNPTIYNETYVITPGSPPFGGNRIYSVPSQVSATSPTGLESAAVTDEARVQLTGETVSFSGGLSTTITSTLWDEAVYVWNGPMLSPPLAGDVVSIGKLTAF